MTVASINPTTGASLGSFEEHTEAEIEAKLAAAERAFAQHRRSPFAERARALVRAAEILERERRVFGQLMSEEMGKTLASAIAEAEKCALACRYYAEHGEAFLRDEPVATDAQASYVRYL